MKLRKNIGRYLDRLDEKWQALPIKRQRLCIFILFILYALFTIGVLFKIRRDSKRGKEDVSIEHIENPVFRNNARDRAPLDTTITLKYNTHERK